MNVTCTLHIHTVYDIFGKMSKFTYPPNTELLIVVLTGAGLEVLGAAAMSQLTACIGSGTGGGLSGACKKSP